ncbi:MAG: Gfo/Idh/MocA family oxidoreductase [Treponema sp.]|nr:Gfo/Idh/MocA family oxidoreductase [Treponema sp.]
MNFGIIGAGRIAEKFSLTFERGLVPGGLVFGVASRDPERAGRFAAAHNIGRSYGAYEDLFADPAIDAVYIATINTEHLRCCEKAIAAGKHVLCEKPLVTNASDARALAAMAEEAGVFLMEAMWTRFLPVILKAEEWVKQGRIGNPRGIKASLCSSRNPDQYRRLFDPLMGGGALLDLGVYCLHLAKHFSGGRKLLGLKASVVRASVSGGLPSAKDDPAAAGDSAGVDLSDYIILDYSGGFTAELSCGITHYAPCDAYIFGDEGYIRVVPWFSSGRKIELFSSPFPAAADNRAPEPADEYGPETPPGFEFEILHMMDRIRAGKIQSDIIPLADTIEVSEIMDRIGGTC